MIKSSFFFLVLVLFLFTSTQVYSRTNLGTFQIRNKNSKKVLGVADSSTQDGAKINQYQPSNAFSQRWYLYSEALLGNVNLYSLISVPTCKAIDVPGFSTQVGTQMQQFTYNGGNNQLWLREKVGDGSWYLKNVGNGLYLTIQDGSKNNGAPLIQSTFSGKNRQRWYFVRVSSDETTAPSPPSSSTPPPPQ